MTDLRRRFLSGDTSLFFPFSSLARSFSFAASIWSAVPALKGGEKPLAEPRREIRIHARLLQKLLWDLDRRLQFRSELWVRKLLCPRRAGNVGPSAFTLKCEMACNGKYELAVVVP